MNDFDLSDGPTLLARTPAILDAWLRGLPNRWLHCDDGPETWNAVEVLGHLIEGEVLEHGEKRPFPPFDRLSQQCRETRTVDQMLDEFALRRRESLAELAALNFGPNDLARGGRHPEFGLVTLGQHLATWVVHDLTHVTQIARVMAREYREAVGPWRAYLRVVREQG